MVAARIAREEVVPVQGLGTSLAPGPNGFHTGNDTYLLNPSYLPPALLVQLAKRMPDGPWNAVLESLSRIVSAPSSHGFAMDWMEAGASGIRAAAQPAESTSGGREGQPVGSYDAIRVYLWLGIADPETPGVRLLLGRASGMAAYMHSAAMPPVEVNAEGTVVHAGGSVGFSAAVVPYLQALGLRSQAKTQQDRMLAARDPGTGLYGRSPTYYDQNLALFSTAWSEQRYRFDRDGRLHLRWK